MTADIWLGASYILGRDVRSDEPYPHICGVDVVGRITRARFRVERRHCAACLANTPPKPKPARALHAVDPAVTTTEHRRLGEKEE